LHDSISDRQLKISLIFAAKTDFGERLSPFPVILLEALKYIIPFSYAAIMTARRDHLISIEEKVQSRWAESHIFETNSESDSEAKQNGRRRTDKYMATFPYPYMNGVLHLGHAFTLVKVDFQCQYQRLKGKNVLYPFGFHTVSPPQR